MSLKQQVSGIIADATSKIMDAVATEFVPPARGSVKRSKPAAKRPAPKRAAKRTQASAARAKRTPDELAKDKDAILKHVKSNPGQGIEQIGRALKRPTSDLSLPMKKLIDEDGSVRTEGEKRATRYYPKGG
jgi:hypothetical protein